MWAVAANRCPSWLRVTRRGVPSRRQFSDRLWRGVLAHFIVRLGGQPLAYLSVFDPDLLSRTARVERVDISELRSTGPTWMAIEEAFLEHVFRTWSFRFLISEYLELQGPDFDWVTPIGCEGGQIRHLGEWHDVIVGLIRPGGVDAADE